jgi:multidrug efflux pump subunit AcrA (membrane-fusion protein)
MAIAKKKRKRWIALIVVVVVAAGGIIGYRGMTMNAAPAYPMVETTTLAKQDLQNLVSVTGNVESTDTKKIFSKLTYPVDELLVEVGDRVSEGDLLCRLDTKTLENSIAKSQAGVNKSQTSANQQLTDAQKALKDAQELLDKDLNTQLLNAEAAVRAAEDALRTAEANKDKAALDVLDARSDLNSYMDGVRDSDEAEEADAVVSEYRRAANRQEIEYENQKANVETRKLELEDAKVKLAAVQETIRQELDSTRDRG